MVNDRSAFNYNGRYVSTALGVTWWVEIKRPWRLKDTTVTHISSVLMLYVKSLSIGFACHHRLNIIYTYVTNGNSKRVNKIDRSELLMNLVNHLKDWSTYLAFCCCWLYYSLAFCFTVIFTVDVCLLLVCRLCLPYEQQHSKLL